MRRRRLQYAPPVVVFGTGGSGTRALQRLLDTAGYFMGTNVNRPGDALEIAWFIRRWLDRYLARSGWVEKMWADGGAKSFRYPGAMAADFRATIADHREAVGKRRRRWGWKVPRTILVFPFVHEFFPGMRAIHLVRDGRDMAYSANQNQARRYAQQLLDPSEWQRPVPIQSIGFWARVNLAAARYGERALGDRYLRLRYEEVCADPDGMASRLVDFLDSPKPVEAMQEVARAEIRPSSSIGRWREREASEIAQLERAGGEALRAFGYA
jgi:Sulfotransferase family